jgi:para-nitrobenzyl esterase
MPPTVETASGTVHGSQGPGFQAFLGIPYAAPPVGDRRFRPPAPPPQWAGVRDATSPGPWAPQNPTLRAARIGGEDAGQDEDCLTLNVWTPAADGARRPVMVWIHGGGFETGSGAGLLYRGNRLAVRGDVVVVTINYRLGVLGFAVSDALRDEDGVAGNWGLLDQVAALRWVRDNIAGFGGDPGNVTIFGESAGGMSVSTLLGTPAAAGLFRRAIAESGPPSVRSLESGEQTLAAILTELDLPAAPAGIAGLREMPVERLLVAQAALSARRRLGEVGLPFSPVVESGSLPETPLAVARRGGAAPVELTIGTNREETTLFSIGDRQAFALDDAALRRRLSRVLPGRVDDAIEVYAKARSDRGEAVTPTALWTAILTDVVFRVPSLRFAEAQAGHQPNTFVYLFTWPTPVLGGILGSPHALEIPFVFGTYEEGGFAAFTGADRDPGAAVLAGRVMDAWTAFARTGSPVGGPAGGPVGGPVGPGAVGGPVAGPVGPGAAAAAWPRYAVADGRPDSRATMIIDRDWRVEAAPMEAERRFWDIVG